MKPETKTELLRTPALWLIAMGLFATAFAAALEAAEPASDMKALAPPPSGRCSYSQMWFPNWPGQNDLPEARLRVLANGDEIVDVGFCINQLWVWLGELRKEARDVILNQVPRTVCTSFGRFTITGANLSQIPLETLLFSMEFRDGLDLEVLALTHDLAGSAQVFGNIEYDLPPSFSDTHPCRALCTCYDTYLGTASGTVGMSVPTIFSDAVYDPFQGDIDWAVEWPRASFDSGGISVSLISSSLACQVLGAVGLPCVIINDLFASLVARDVAGGVIEQKVSAKVHEILEDRLDPNDYLSSFLGPSSTIASALQQAAAALGISIPSPPCGTRFTLYIENPPPDRSSGGAVTIALFAPE